jgi:RecJ-like exonuclease
MLKRGHKHDWRTSSAVAGSGCVITCCCGALVRVLLVGGRVRPEVLRDGEQTFTVRDGQTVVQLAAAVLGPPGRCEDCGGSGMVGVDRDDCPSCEGSGSSA